SDGILVLEGAQADNEPGTPVAKVLHVPPLLDLSVTPNRGDCLSAIGLAREVAALTGGELHEPEFALNEQDGAASEVASVEVQAPDLCPRYCARVIEGVKIGPSPMWLAELLESHGIRPISNIVDVTNYILLLHGQPLHAFDLDHIGEGKIIVRKAAAGEKMKTLDDVERTLEEGDLVIADPKGPVALAGVMGGASSEVTDSTTRVLLEAAYFEPGTVRRTSRRLGLISESSYRFERGIDPLRVTVAMDHAAAMMAELGGGSVRSGFIDESAQDFAPAKITLRPARVCALLGVEIPAERIAAHLKSLGFGVDDSSAESFAVTVPSWRRLDITLEADLIEEVARIEGYDNVPETLPSSGREHGEDDEPLHLQEALEDALVARGWRQSVHLSFASPGWADDFGIAEGDSRRKAVRIANPINEEEGVLRAALLPSLVKTYVRNRNHGVRQVRLFEVGRVFEEQGAGVAGGELPKERLSLAMIAGTLDEPGLWRAGDPARAALFAAKADLEALGGCFGLELKLAGPSDEPYLHPGRRASVMLGKQVLGHWGELHPEVAAKLGVRDRVVACELDAGALLQAALGRKPKFSAFSNLPRMWRDLALLVSDEVPAGRVVAKALAAGAPLAQHGEIFDEFRGKGIEEGKRSLGLRMCYGAADRTLTEEEAAGAEAKVLETLEKEFGAQRR
ncbi:MAG: phenylalanine--tRNA ligase subunit beta, partial [Chrysiogenetes bacterium]|nr:phenylalanine--tRNA ligase subunit beta [Chrysiogenetes bacterium]